MMPKCFRALGRSNIYLIPLESLFVSISHASYIPQKHTNIYTSFSTSARYLEPHPIVPEDLLAGDSESLSIADAEPDIESAESNIRRFLGVVTDLEPTGGKFAVVRTLSKVDVLCSAETCEGWGRLRIGQLVQIRYHLSGLYKDMVFIECAAEQCTRATSLAGSRAPSRPPSRPPSRSASELES